MKFQLATAAAALAFAALALAAGTHRLAALVGALVAGSTALASILFMGRAASRSRKPMQGALLVFAIVFLARIVLVGAAAALVAKAGWNVFAFVIAFFVPYFVFTALEGAYLHSLRRTGT
ncbi:MAG TPA: hypothetical protein VFP50_10970 [Anaeromyxobacteraceae bacterium]|nr:hypothetical protein [Anaeromyxobacteraceae bacterium]